MSEGVLFMFGIGITAVVSAGLFVYGMYSFRDWSVRQEKRTVESSAARTDSVEN
jgi:predicted transporter